jgi:membrane-anchored glycerophosphoryl diester phosphodiesterase (GDPDase)
MSADQNNKILAIGFAAFAGIFFFTFMLLLVVSAGVFVALGITFANETGNSQQAGIGILGGVFAIVFYVVLGLIFVLPTAIASWKLFKRRKKARLLGTIAAILVVPILPLGTILGIYGLWFFFSAEGKQFYSNIKS